MLQVLWECGWIDENNLMKYTVNGRRNKLGVIDTETSFKYLLGHCHDFEEEELLLQSQGRHLGIAVNRMPKYYCELAGEDIEYSWGCTKNFYRQ
jgi:hypothetical protein